MPQALLSARGITRAIGPRTILREVSLDLDDGARVGLIGPNGSGKSTLMRVLAGVEPPDAGSVVLARDAAVLYLPQLDGHDDEPIRVALHELLGVAQAGSADGRARGEAGARRARRRRRPRGGDAELARARRRRRRRAA